MMDHFGPTEYGPGEAVGAPDHPHRGFVTVTYMLQGEFEHRDSAGNHGVLRDGDVQWMTAGRGVVHSETPSQRVMDEGGTIDGFQLWVNLPAKDKMVEPDYQDTRSALIPVVPLPSGHGGTVKVITGSVLGTKAVIETKTPIQYYDVRMQPGDFLDIPLPASHNTWLYVHRGEGQFGPNGTVGKESDMLIFDKKGDGVRLSNPETNEAECGVIFFSGEPIGEPIAQYGPFVMNTREELMQAFADYQSGRLAPEMEGGEQRHREAQEAKQRQRATGRWQRDQRDL